MRSRWPRGSNPGDVPRVPTRFRGLVWTQVTLCDGEAVPPHWLHRHLVVFARHQKCKKAQCFDHHVAEGWEGEEPRKRGVRHVKPSLTCPRSPQSPPHLVPSRAIHMHAPLHDCQPLRPLVSGRDMIPRAHLPLRLPRPLYLLKSVHQVCSKVASRDNAFFFFFLAGGGGVVVKKKRLWGVKPFLLLNLAHTVSKQRIMSQPATRRVDFTDTQLEA